MNEGWTRHDVSPFSTTLNLEIPGVKDASRPETWLERVAGRPALGANSDVKLQKGAE